MCIVSVRVVHDKHRKSLNGLACGSSFEPVFKFRRIFYLRVLNFLIYLQAQKYINLNPEIKYQYLVLDIIAGRKCLQSQ